MTSGRVERIETAEALGRLLEVLEVTERVGIDTESNAFHAWRERVCLIQLSTGDREWIVDPLAIDPAPLGPYLADPRREWVFHAAEYDVRTLKRDFGFVVARLFDTQLAAMLLGRPQLGYGGLVAERLGVELEKAHQRSDWGRRPLSESQLDYAAADARYLLPLRDLLEPEVEARGRAEEARALFDLMSGLPPAERVFDETGYFKLPGYADLDATGRAVARALYLAREREAGDRDVPPFKVLNNEAISNLARVRPTGEDDAGKVRGVTRNTLRRWGPRLFEAIEEGEADPEPPPRRPERRRRTAEDMETEARFDRLKIWRRQTAKARDVAPQIIAPSGLLKAVARAAPEDTEALARVPEMDAWRLARYGQEMLRAIVGDDATQA